MKKIVIDKPGSFDRLRLIEEPTPSPRPGYALVRTRAVGVNFADCVVRLGLYPSAKKYVGWPITPGFEFSGTIESLGAPVDEAKAGEGEAAARARKQQFEVGDEVYGVVRFFAYATHVEVPLSQIRKKPATLTLDEAGAAPVAALTAHYALIEQGAVRAGERVLIHSAAGGVGGALVQMARIKGCQVTAVVGASHKVDYVQQLGADTVIDKSQSSWVKRAAEVAGEGYDLVFDANGVETLRDSYRLLRPTGRLVSYGAHTMLTRGSGRPNWLKLAWDFVRTPRFSPLDLTNDNKSVMAFNLSYLFDEEELFARGFDELTAWYAEGQLRVPELQTFPLEQAGEAHRVLQGGSTRGKLVLITS